MTPADLREHVSAGRYLLTAAEFFDGARSLGLPEPEAAEALLAGAGAARGRAPTAIAALPGRPERIHLRGVRHGGWLGRLRGGALISPARPAWELRAAALLEARGAPVPHPALVAAWRRGVTWQAIVGTVHFEGARDGLVYLEGAPAPDEVDAAAAAAGRAVRRFHEAGGHHPDLHVKNLLFGSDPTQVLVIDLDGARAAEPPDPRRRMREIMRLYRSLIKRGLLASVGPRARASFLDAYTDDESELRQALLRYLPRERRRVAWHRIGYRLWGGA